MMARRVFTLVVLVGGVVGVGVGGRRVRRFAGPETPLDPAEIAAERIERLYWAALNEKREDQFVLAREALLRTGRPGVNAMLAALDDPENETYYRVLLYSLFDSSEGDELLGPEIVEALGDSSAAPFWTSCILLVRTNLDVEGLALDADAMTREIENGLDADDPYKQLVAESALRQMGITPPGAPERLVEVLNGPETVSFCRCLALVEIIKIDQEVPGSRSIATAAPAIALRLDDPGHFTYPKIWTPRGPRGFAAYVKALAVEALERLSGEHPPEGATLDERINLMKTWWAANKDRYRAPRDEEAHESPGEGGASPF
jgi:hypothetical protein